METIDQFIKRLQAISEDKRKLPLVIACPNGLLVSPKIKMVMKDNMPFEEVVKMIITY
jgi:hypothetical protein